MKNNDLNDIDCDFSSDSSEITQIIKNTSNKTQLKRMEEIGEENKTIEIEQNSYSGENVQFNFFETNKINNNNFLIEDDNLNNSNRSNNSNKNQTQKEEKEQNKNKKLFECVQGEICDFSNVKHMQDLFFKQSKN